MKINAEILNKIEQIQWFTRCGLSIEDKIATFEVLKVDSWKEAQIHCGNSAWEQTTLDARNALTMYLNNRCHTQYQNWNKLVREAKAFWGEKILPKISGVQQVNNLDDLFIHCVSWDIVNGILEDAFAECRPPTFFLKLIQIYESGHFPCGWDGDWPQGRLIVF